MSAITDQQIADAQSYPPVDTTAWDPSLSWASQRIDGENADNAGCPPGYFTIYLPSALGTFGAPYVRACRYVATSTAQTIRQETAPPMVDQTVINLADATKQIKEALTPSIPNWVWVLGGLFAVTFFFPYRTGRAVRQVYEGARRPNPETSIHCLSGRHSSCYGLISRYVGPRLVKTKCSCRCHWKRNPIPLWALHAGRHAAIGQITKVNRRRTRRR